MGVEGWIENGSLKMERDGMGKWVGLGGEGWKREDRLGGLVEEYGVREYWGLYFGIIRSRFESFKRDTSK